jgi:hypothetical protein
MHQRGSPLTSGRTILWRTIPILFLSPIISTLVSGSDLQIYLPVSYGFLLVLLFQYRQLCHEWSTWTSKIPTITMDDILNWYTTKVEPQSDSTSAVSVDRESSSAEAVKKAALQAFLASVEAHRRGLFGSSSIRVPDPVVSRVAKGMPYVEWLLQKDTSREKAEPFSVSWFAQLNQALKDQKQMAQGLKEHSIFMLFRYARYDIGQNVGLFLIALMDRWVSLSMASNSTPVAIFIDDRARYVLCFAILYFCSSVMTLDGTLQKYWQETFKLSEEKLINYDHAKSVEENWESRRRWKYFAALFELFRRIFFLFGVSTIFVWLFVSRLELLSLYYAYVVGYTAVMVFQFNRCFTTDVKSHVVSILCSAPIGFITGCVLHGVYRDNPFFYTDVIAMDVAAVSAALLTSIWVWKDFHFRESKGTVHATRSAEKCLKQPRLADAGFAGSKEEIVEWKALPGRSIKCETPVFLARRIEELLDLSVQEPNDNCSKAPWSLEVLEVAQEMWAAGKIVITLSTNGAFAEAGFDDAFSFSKYDGITLEITAGFLGETELHHSSWGPLHAYL